MGALDDGERVLVANGAAWRAWLTENSATSTGAWLVRARPGSDVHVVTYEDAIRQALCFGWIDGPTRSFDDRVGGLWFSPRRPRSGWAATNKARVVDLEATGEMTDAGRRAVAVARENGWWTVLDNAEALREPEDLAAALRTDPTALAAWSAFPPSARKLGIARVDLAMRPETRAARIAKILTDSRNGIRPS